MLRDVVAFIARCDICQRCKVEQRPRAGLMGRRVIEESWTTIATDIMGPDTRSKTGFSYVLVVQDLFTKWVKIVPLCRATRKHISEALENLIFYRWGTPRVLLTDNRTEFINKDVRRLTQVTGVRHHTTPPYHQQSNPVERANRVLKRMLLAYIDSDQGNWDAHLHEFRFAYHASLRTSLPFANFGREPQPAISMQREVEGDLEILP